MTDINELSKKLPPKTRESVLGILEVLTPEERKNLESIISGFPSDLNLMRTLLRLSANHIRMTFGKKHAVAIVGPTNVGKSTLYNQLVLKKIDRAEVSPLPGTTRENQSAESDLFTIIDTPGADAVGEVGEHERDEAFEAARQADFIIVVFDAIQGIKKTELELYRQILSLAKPHVVVLNKIDLVRKQSATVVENAARNLGITQNQVIPIVAKTGENLSQILISIAVNEPELVAALGQALPQYRWQLAWRAIISAASISAGIALTPLPIIDFAPLVVTQSIMVLGIARIYNYKITLVRARELVATFGLGFLGRTLFSELSKFGGIPGWILSAAIASSTTIVMGYAASIWFEKGEKVSGESLKKMASTTTSYMLGVLRGLGKRKPGQKDLREQIAQALENSPISTERSSIEKQADISGQSGLTPGL